MIGVIAADLVARTVLTGSAASSIGLWDGVFVVVGVTLIQRWYKQGQAASPNAPTSSPGSSVLSCSECGHENPAEVNFCTKCRAKMTLQCSKCGFKSPQGSEFCGSCGAETEVGAAVRIAKVAKLTQQASQAVRDDALFSGCLMVLGSVIMLYVIGIIWLNIDKILPFLFD